MVLMYECTFSFRCVSVHKRMEVHFLRVNVKKKKSETHEMGGRRRDRVIMMKLRGEEEREQKEAMMEK